MRTTRLQSQMDLMKALRRKKWDCYRLLIIYSTLLTNQNLTKTTPLTKASRAKPNSDQAACPMTCENKSKDQPAVKFNSDNTEIIFDKGLLQGSSMNLQLRCSVTSNKE